MIRLHAAVVATCLVAAWQVVWLDAGQAATRTLAAEARYVASHGGVQGTCWGCATPRMKSLARRLVIRRFTPTGSYAVRKALCIVQRESGFNPGAYNGRDTAGGSFGLAQINGVHRYRYDFDRILDPVYNVGVMWAMSSRGTSWGPWEGAPYSCG